MKNKGKCLGIDYGDRRVGIAVSDENKEISFPRDFLEYTGMKQLIIQIEQICEKEGVDRIVIGLPIMMNGEFGERAQKTQVFHNALKEVMPDMDIVLFDERLSTEFAIINLRGQGIKAKNQRDKRDAASAQIILNNYLASIQ